MTRAHVAPLSPDQTASIASEIATALLAIEHLSCMASAATDVHDRGALLTGIECIAKHAGSLADLVNVAQGGVPVVGPAGDWSRPACMQLRPKGVHGSSQA